MSKKKKKEAAPISTQDFGCYHLRNRLGGFVGSHTAFCSAVGPQTTKTKTGEVKPGRATCDEPAEVHARFEGHCGHYCAPCGKAAGDRGAVLSAIESTEERLPRVLHRVVPEDAADIPAEVAETAPASKPASETGNGSASKPAGDPAPLLERVLQRSRENPLYRGELSPKERKLARELATRDVIVRQNVNGKISYYPIEATA